MSNEQILIIGGGLTGLSTACYALRNGFRARIFEHNLALGGVCTAWERSGYTIDGCIHWLIVGPFFQIYEELGITQSVRLQTIDALNVYRNVREGWSIALDQDLERLRRDLVAVAPQDRELIDRTIDASRKLADLEFPIRAPELMHLRDRLRQLRDRIHDLPTFFEFRGSIGDFIDKSVKSPRFARFLETVLDRRMPIIILPVLLSYLEQGALTRPVGGSGRFRDALVARFRELGGEAELDTTVEEIVVESNRATGVRLADGTIVRGNVVVSTSSAPETILRLLGGRHGRDELQKRLTSWQTFEPIMLASFGVDRTFEDQPTAQVFDEIRPIHVGNTKTDHLYVRLYHDDPSLAPSGHTIAQTMIPTT